MNVNLPSEAHLVDALQQRKPADFTLFYNTYQATLYRVLVQLIDDPIRAQDLLQDTFVKIWMNGHQYNPRQGRLYTWLVTITRNTALNELKNQTLRRRAEGYNQNWPGELMHPAYPEGVINQHLLSSLSPKYRVVVDLIYLQGFTSQEVADKLKLPLGTVKTQLRTGLQQLKAFFGQDIHYYRGN